MNRRLPVILIATGMLASGAAIVVGCGTSNGTADMMKPACNPFTPAAECKPTEVAVTPLKGSRQVVISTLQIANYNEGFDLNCDGKVDNLLSVLGAAANQPINDSFSTKHDIIIPIEFFGYTGADSDCSKFAFYLGRVNEDKDGDGANTTWEHGKGDCDDTDKNIHPGAKEDLTNGVDDDCDGFADNDKPGSPPTVMRTDMDGDGVTIAQGDCDDRNDTPEHLAIAKLRHKGAKDICGNGIDDDCDGTPDNDASCDPFKDNNVPLHAQALSFQNPVIDANGMVATAGLKPFIVFPDGKVKSSVLTAGPDLFELNLALDKDLNLKLTLSGAHVKLKLKEQNGGTYVTEGILGGVLEAVSLAQIHIAAGGFLKKEQSLLDGVFVGAISTLLGLQTDKDGHYLPDIDVDGDGLETFWQENDGPVGDGGMKIAIVDSCKDGDGTIVHNNWDGKGSSCALAKDSKGNYRFVDGLSAALKFTAVPAKIGDVTAK